MWRRGKLNLTTLAAIAAMVIGASLLAAGVWANLQQRRLTMQVEVVDAPGAVPQSRTVEVDCGSKAAPVSDPVPYGCGEHLASYGFATVAVPWVGVLLLAFGGGVLIVGRLGRTTESENPSSKTGVS